MVRIIIAGHCYPSQKFKKYGRVWLATGASTVAKRHELTETTRQDRARIHNVIGYSFQHNDECGLRRRVLRRMPSFLSCIFTSSDVLFDSFCLPPNPQSEDWRFGSHFKNRVCFVSASVASTSSSMASSSDSQSVDIYVSDASQTQHLPAIIAAAGSRKVNVYFNPSSASGQLPAMEAFSDLPNAEALELENLDVDSDTTDASKVGFNDLPLEILINIFKLILSATHHSLSESVANNTVKQKCPGGGRFTFLISACNFGEFRRSGSSKAGN
jgi:hypothetical protein